MRNSSKIEDHFLKLVLTAIVGNSLQTFAGMLKQNI